MDGLDRCDGNHMMDPDYVDYGSSCPTDKYREVFCDLCGFIDDAGKYDLDVEYSPGTREVEAILVFPVNWRRYIWNRRTGLIRLKHSESTFG